ncbi:hypothetical protein [Caulobacter sp. LARHSG274]
MARLKTPGRKTLDAPTYVSAPAFEQPVGAPAILSVESFSIEELMRVPQAWAIVLKHVPSVRLVVAAQQAKPHLGNMTLSSFALYLPLTPTTYAAIDAELAQLPKSL